MIETKRIKMYPASREQMEEIIALEPCEELKVAYSEMLEGCLQHIDEWEWYAMWNIELNNGTRVGDLCFKGLDSKGVVEIGYGILEEYQGQGYFSRLFKFMIEDLKSRGYEKVTLGVEPDETKNKSIYFNYGFNEHIKDSKEVYPDGTEIDVEYYGKSIK